MEIGLGVPRDKIYLVIEDGKKRLFQPATGRDLTGDMIRFVENFLEGLGNVDAAILKKYSPSCGIESCKVYMDIRDIKNKKFSYRGAGFFSEGVLKKFPDVIAGDEEGLADLKNQERFLKKLGFDKGEESISKQ
jgi:uncharacterized protein YbbK (DUF523 family)